MLPAGIPLSFLGQLQRALTQLSKAMLAIFADALFFGKDQNFGRVYSGAGRIWIEFSGNANVTLSEGKPEVPAYTLIEVTEVRDYWVAWIFRVTVCL